MTLPLMTKILRIMLLAIAGIMTASFAPAQEKSAPPQQGLKVMSGAEDKSSPASKEPYLIRVKTRSAVNVTGSVVRVDRTAKSITLKGKGKTITFDVVNPSLVGYESLDEIKAGETVTVSYIREGLQIRKGLPPEPPRPRAARVNTAPPRLSEQKKTEPKIMKQRPEETKTMPSRRETKRPQKTASVRTAPVRLRDKKGPSEFRDVDNNKDGRVSPVELSVIIPDLTLQQFRECDKNGDGLLDEQEFRAAKRNR